MQSTTGLILLRSDDPTLSALPLWTYYLLQKTPTTTGVDVLLFLHLKRQLPHAISTSTARVIEGLDGKKSLDEIEHLLGDEPPPRVSLFIDSIDYLIECFGLEKTASFLHRLPVNKYASVFATATTSHNLEWQRLASIASMTLDICDGGGGIILCKTNRAGKKETLEKFNISTTNDDNGSLILNCSIYKDQPKKEISLPAVNNSNTPAADLLLLQNVPFDVGLNLNEAERKAKASVQLPYTIAKREEDGLVGLKRAGGQIVYTPDAEDDFDESDPDEDLEI